MQVFKFGGASVNSVKRVKMIGDILKLYPNEKILVVISAMGKSTNALEKVVNAFYENKKEEDITIISTSKATASQYCQISSCCKRSGL